MTTVSFTNVTTSFSFTPLGFTSAIVELSSTRFAWTTQTGSTLSASGTDFSYDGTDFSGTVTQLTLDTGNDGHGPDVVFSDLSFGLSTLMPSLNNLSPVDLIELLARTLMGGDDTVDFGTSGNYILLNGDGFIVKADEVITGGDDTMSGSIGSGPLMSGDFETVELDGTLYGGDDTIDVVVTEGGSVFGDASAVSGMMIGGDDVLTVGLDQATTGYEDVRAYGDADEVKGGGMIIGGDDTIVLGGARSDYLLGIGDVGNVVGTVFGGDDTISVDEDYTGSVMIYGDVASPMSGSFVKGGNDTITGGAGADVLNGDISGCDNNVTVKGGDDVIYGGGGDDILRGDGDVGNSTTSIVIGGNDRLYGGAGADNLYGNGGDDLLDGGADSDGMHGGEGDDIYVVDNAGDQIYEDAGEGADLVKSSIAWTLGDNVENLKLIGDEDISGTGNEDDNNITGNLGNNTLNGGGGTDTLAGGYGDDIYIVDSADDVIVESLRQGSADVVAAKVSYTLTSGAYVEFLRAYDEASTAALDLTGNDLGQSISGNAGVNTLTGGAGDDMLDGLGGADVLLGGDGDDTYVVDEAGVQAVEQSGEGTDLVKASISWLLGNNIENLKLTGTDAISGTGNSGANTITGNDAANKLDGGEGADTLAGGDGSDTYIVDNSGDVITELTGNGDADVVRAKVSYLLNAGAYVERLTAHDAGATTALNLSGNDLGQSIGGNAGANILSGGAGNDTLKGLAGRDTLIGGAGKDVFVFDAALIAANVDTVDDFNRAADTFQIDNLFFKGLKAGTLSARDFAIVTSEISTKGVDASDRILYDKADGDLYFDRDGAGKKFNRELFAHVDDGTQLTNADFFII